MAYRIRGGGEQTAYPPASGAAKRTYYAEHDVEEKRRRVAYAVDIKDTADARLISRPTVTHIPECDVPYRSIEPRDSPMPVPADDKGRHIFYVLYEEGHASTTGRLHLQDRQRDIESRSPLPPTARDRLYPALPGPKHWATDMDDHHFADSPTPAHTNSTPQQSARYEDWRERNCAYDMAADQEEEARSFSPFVVRPPSSELRHTPEMSISASRLKHPVRGDVRDEFDAVYDYESSLGRHDPAAAHMPRTAPPSTPGTSVDGAGYLVVGGAGGHPHHITSSGSATPRDASHDARDDGTCFISDDAAADNVAAHLASFMRRHPTSRQERILRSLIHPKSASGVADFELDDVALNNILRTANDLFFDRRLTHRVRWDWSGKNADPQYDSRIIGHTSLRLRKQDDGGGIETFILLSTPILKNRAYSRRLLISAFLHELIHCYLFVCCGWKARKDGGHTDGFRRIADTIDQWAGRDNLFLCQIEADLEQFRQAPLLPLSYVLGHGHHVCRPAKHYSDHDHPEPWWGQHRHEYEWE